jgi:hypothetical protein
MADPVASLMGTLEVFREDDLLSRLVAGHGQGESFVFLVGSPLAAPARPGEPGVPGVPAMIHRVRTLLGNEVSVPTPGASNPYQDAFSLLIARRGLPAANRLVREAVLEACLTPDRELRERAASADVEACRELERDVGGWALAPGAEALGRILTAFPETFGGTLLTTNFDPLLSVGIRRANGREWTTALHGEGNLEQAAAEGCHVVHAHGRWDRTDTLHTPTQLQQPRPQLKASLRRLCERSVLVVLAYGGWDDVFSRTLMELVEDGGAFPGVLWGFRAAGREDVLATSRALLQGLRPGIERGRVVLYGGIDCHVFLPRLCERLAVLRSEAASSSEQDPEGSRRPVSPFVVGMPITRDEDFFGRRYQRGLLEDALSRGQPIQILGERRMGKTSLLRWVERHAPRVQHRPVAWVNAQGLAGRSPAELVQVAAWALGRLPQVEPLFEERTGVPGARVAEEALLQLLPCALLVDEAAALAAPESGFDQAFLNLLRALGQDGKLLWVSASGEDLQQHFGQLGLTSHFLNDSRRVSVGQLEEEAARELAARGLAAEQVERVLGEAGGFAYGLQCLCDLLWRGVVWEEAVDALADEMASTMEGWWRRRGPGDQALLKRLAAGVPAVDLDRPLRQRARRLVAAGLAAEGNGEFSLPDRLWRNFVLGA